MEICGVRGALATWLHVGPLGRVKFLVSVANLLDRIMRKVDSHQVSGYYVFVIK